MPSATLLREDSLISHFSGSFPTTTVIAFILLLCPLRSSGSTGPSGEAVYKEYCAGCHDQTNLHVPHRDVLKQMTSARILRTLDFGLMMRIAYPMSRREREAVARFLGRQGPEPGLPASAFCSDRGSLRGKTGENWNGWSPTAENTRFQAAEQARLTLNQVPQLKLKWAFGFSGDVTAFAAPTIFDGVLYVGSAAGVVHAMDAKTGCLHWVFQANGPVRSAVLAAKNGARWSLLFGDQIGWFYSLDSQTGRLLWKRKIDSHDATRLTGSPVEQHGIVFVPAASWEESRSGGPGYVCCTFRGSVTALRVKDGSVVWKSYMVDPPKRTAGSKMYGPSGASIWSAPTVDSKRGLLYVGTGNNYSPPATKTSDAIVALQIATGRIQWTQQTTSGDAADPECDEEKTECPPDYDYGASPALVHVSGRDLVIAGQKSGIVYALDPDQSGKILWQTRVGKGSALGGVEWGMATDERRVYAAVDDSLRKAGGGGGPVGGAEFDPVQGGGMTALRLEDGAKEWLAPSQPCAPPRPGCSPAQPGAVTAIPGVVFSGSMDGHIRAFASEDGKLLWDFDTVREYDTVDGIKAKGGSLDGAGPVIANGVLYVNSGYPRFGGMSGNVLLAFGLDDPQD
jgi:polyvinyl alcohol dehydrogenase (cytochrome)